MTIYIKNTFCTRCKEVIGSEFDKLGIKITSIGSGEVRVKYKLTPEQHRQITASLDRSGFTVLDEEEKKIMDKIKMIAGELIYYSDEELKSSLPGFLRKKLRKDYSYLSNLFFEVKNTSIENYLSMYKIERAKELLVHYKLNLNEIALQLNFNSVASLTNQFKEHSGFPPSHFREVKRVRQTSEVNV